MQSQKRNVSAELKKYYNSQSVKQVLFQINHLKNPFGFKTFQPFRKYHRYYSLRTADAFPVVASLPPLFFGLEGEKRGPEMRLLFAGYRY